MGRNALKQGEANYASKFAVNSDCQLDLRYAANKKDIAKN